ncbi:hypothetical protein DM02DRAFT_43661 [Periconia macrospinosa]|uniref:Secreted protein n=1 Tax=Periconia macrospinosa TaxID=97972 RepID=A0A2V1CX89_9PLEO|nr:hypothetical protein DM02DRAFT_43661 [Periconia macrospinosa]
MYGQAAFRHPRQNERYPTHAAVLWCLCIGTLASSAHLKPDNPCDVQRHLDHCIETLRRNTMCRADASVDTFVWTDLHAQKPAMKSTGTRKCVEWNKLESWAFARKTVCDSTR